MLFKTGLNHYLLASINDENLRTKLNKILAPFGSRTEKIEDIIMKSSCNLSVEYLPALRRSTATKKVYPTSDIKEGSRKVKISQSCLKGKWINLEKEESQNSCLVGHRI